MLCYWTMQKQYPFDLRPIFKPTISLPLACRSVGRVRTFSGWHNPPTSKDFCKVFWGIRGRGQLLVDTQPVELLPDHVMVLFPGDVNHVTAVDDWEHYWMTLDGQIPGKVLKALSLGQQPVYAGPCPIEMFERLALEIYDISPRGQRIASSTAYNILTTANVEQSNSPASHPQWHQNINQCVELIRSSYHDPDLNVTAMARHVNMHRTNFSKLFKQIMKISPVEYLTIHRVNQAMQLIQGSDLPFAEIAQQAGFTCPNYFTNVMRKRTGYTPTQLRDRANTI